MPSQISLVSVPHSKLKIISKIGVEFYLGTMGECTEYAAGVTPTERQEN